MGQQRERSAHGRGNRNNEAGFLVVPNLPRTRQARLATAEVSHDGVSDDEQSHTQGPARRRSPRRPAGVHLQAGRCRCMYPTFHFPPKRFCVAVHVPRATEAQRETASTRKLLDRLSSLVPRPVMSEKAHVHATPLSSQSKAPPRWFFHRRRHSLLPAPRPILSLRLGVIG